MDGIFAQPPSLKISVFVVFNGEGKKFPSRALVCVPFTQNLRHSIVASPPSAIALFSSPPFLSA